MIDSPTKRGEQWLKKLLQLSGVSANVQGEVEEATSSSYGENEEQDNYWLIVDENDLTPEQIEIIIGENGEVLDAIQYLANSTLNINQVSADQASYTIELNGYRVKREAEIRQLASEAALEARATGREVEIKSLSSAERRQVHTFLKDYNDLETFSRGKEPHRQLVVRLASFE